MRQTMSFELGPSRSQQGRSNHVSMAGGALLLVPKCPMRTMMADQIV
jgi:hypothetical protein